MLALQTGLRAAELTGLRCEDIVLGSGAHVRCEGKGRKSRCTPLGKDTVLVMRSWLRERQGQPCDPAFPTTRGTALSHDALQYMLDKHLPAARRQCPSLARKRVTPHVLRHTLAMDLLHHGAEQTVIALWLGHESPETTSIYLHADMQLKERALANTTAKKVPIPASDPATASWSSSRASDNSEHHSLLAEPDLSDSPASIDDRLGIIPASEL